MRCRICAKFAVLVAGAICAMLFIGVTSAQAQSYSWAGFYIGGNAGVHWSRDQDLSYLSANPGGFIPAAVAQINNVLPVVLTPTGAAGGVQAGYNWQFSETVLGLEADFDAFGGSDTRSTNLGLILPPSANPLSDSASDRWMTTLRARLGYTFGLRGLFYVTGGAAWANWSTAHTFGYGFGTASSEFGVVNNNMARLGWVAGGGIEVPVVGNWTARAEYLFADFGTATSYLNSTLSSSGALQVTVTEPEKLTEQIVRIGVSYAFH